jgi:cytochrome c oxidase subunit 4
MNDPSVQEAHPDRGPEAAQPHLVPVRVYLLVFAALLLLTAITVTAAGHDFGLFNTVVALSIAVTKAMLVLLFFMHVKYADHLTWLIVAAGFVMLGLLLFITMTDYASRGWTLL